MRRKNDPMMHELSFLVYGGSPKKMLQCSSDINEQERQAMMKWCDQLRVFGKYDEFISSGGNSWIDVPTLTGRRLFLRVFATQGESRDSWYSLGVLLSEADYKVIGDYGSLVAFVESFSIVNLLSNRIPGSKMAIDIRQTDVIQNTMPPLFSKTIDSDWTTANWIQSRVKKIQHNNGSPLHIAFNPPNVKSEYTTLLLSDGFPMPGLRLKPTAENGDSEGRSDEKKKKSAKLSIPILLSLLISAFAIGYAVRFSTLSHVSLLKTSVIANGEKLLLPTIRWPRSSTSSFVFLVDGNRLDSSKLSVRANVQWIKIGSPTRKANGALEYPCKVELSKSQPVNEALEGSLAIVQDGIKVAEYPVEIESADIDISLQGDSQVDGTPPTNERIVRGFASSRYGIASVIVNSVPAVLELSSSGRAAGTLGVWRLSLESESESVNITLVDRNGNEFTTTEQLPFKQPKLQTQ